MGWLTCTGTKCAPPSRLSFRTTCDPRVQEPKPADVHWPPSKMLLTCRRNRHQMRSRPQLCRGQPPNVVQRGRATTSRSDGHRRETLRRCPTRTRLSRFRQNATVAHFVMLLRKGRQRSIAGGTTFQRFVGDSVSRARWCWRSRGAGFRSCASRTTNTIPMRSRSGTRSARCRRDTCRAKSPRS